MLLWCLRRGNLVCDRRAHATAGVLDMVADGMRDSARIAGLNCPQYEPMLSVRNCRAARLDPLQSKKIEFVGDPPRNESQTPIPGVGHQQVVKLEVVAIIGGNISHLVVHLTK